MGVSQYAVSRFLAYSVDQINALRKRPKYREVELKVRREREAAVRNAAAVDIPTPDETPHVAGRRESPPGTNAGPKEWNDQRT